MVRSWFLIALLSALYSASSLLTFCTCRRDKNKQRSSSQIQPRQRSRCAALSPTAQCSRGQLLVVHQTVYSTDA
jgi:hypothetical protein